MRGSQLLAVDDTGVWYSDFVKNRAEFLGETVEDVGDQMTLSEEFAPNYVACAATERDLQPYPSDTYAALGFPSARDLARLCLSSYAFTFLAERAEIAQCWPAGSPMQTFGGVVTSPMGGKISLLVLQRRAGEAVPWRYGRSVNHFSQPLPVRRDPGWAREEQGPAAAADQSSAAM